MLARPQNTMLVSTKVLGYLSYARLSYANAWCVAWRRGSGAARRRLLTRALRRAISMFSVVPLSYNVVDEMCKERKPRELDPIDVSPA